jgi:hypothetical protein
MFKQKEIIVPKLDQTILEEYLALKESQTVIFNDDIANYLEKEQFREYVESEEFMEILIDFVALNIFNRTADNSIKQNIFTVINYLKSNKNYKSASEKKELFINLNEIITTLNTTSDQNNIKFYRDQFYKRSDQKRTDFWDAAYDKKFIEERKESLNYSISFDYAPIYDLSQVESEEEFITDVVPDNLVSHYFINTLNILFSEMPSLYSDDKFVKRAKMILKNNILLAKGKKSIYELDEDDEIDRDLVPRTKKLLRKIKRISR